MFLPISCTSPFTVAMTILPAAPVVNDAYYFGAQTPFRELTITLSQAGDGVYTIAWEYWTGFAWTAVPGLHDGTYAFSQDGSVAFTPPAGWAVSSVNSVAAYHLRARVSAFTCSRTGPSFGASTSVVNQCSGALRARLWFQRSPRNTSSASPVKGARGSRPSSTAQMPAQQRATDLCDDKARVFRRGQFTGREHEQAIQG